MRREKCQKIPVRQPLAAEAALGRQRIPHSPCTACRAKHPLAMIRFVHMMFALFSAMGILSAGPMPDTTATDRPAAPVLTTTKEVRGLDRALAAKTLPVRVRGVVTFCYPEAVLGFIIECEGTGIWVGLSGMARRQDPAREPPEANLAAALPASKPLTATVRQLQPGQEVEVCGFTVPGGYAPSIAAESVRVLGNKPLPPPPRLDPSRLLTGALDSQRVRIEGVVQNAAYEDKHSTRMALTLAMPGHRFSVRVIERGQSRVEDWVGARIEATAVGSVYFNERAELLGAFLTTTDFSSWRIMVPPPADPFAVPSVGLGQMLPFSQSDPVLTRQRLSGTVTLFRRGEFIMIEVDQRAVRVNTSEVTSYQPGDIVEASGFVELRQNFAELTGAVIRKIGQRAPPQPEALRIAEVLVKLDATRSLVLTSNDYYGRLVTFDALLQLNEPWEGGRRLLCASDNRSFTAILAADSGAAAIAELRPGSNLRLTGVCDLQYSASQPSMHFAYPTGVTLQMRSPADVVVTRAASWWTVSRLLLALGGTAAVTLGALLWAGQLRRRVAAQSAVIGRQMAHVTLHAERTRMARELHDTLDQELMGVALQLDAAHDVLAAAPAKAQRVLHSAQALLKHTRSEARRCIWDLRNSALEDADLPGALNHSLRQFSASDVPAISLEVSGVERRLPYRIETNLLRITTEAATNAVKHAHAQHVWVTLDFGAGDITLTINDDGCGFETASAARLADGHFGLLGMRERAQQLGAALDVRSTPGSGTQVRVILPNKKPPASPP